MALATEKPKYLELADLLRQSIRNGELKVGERLPSYAELYEKHGASTATVQRACDLLDQEKLIDRRNGSGIYVASPHQSHTGIIGIIGSENVHRDGGPFYLSLMSAVQQALKAQQRHMLYLGNQDSWNPEMSNMVDGVLICDVEETHPLLQKLPPHLHRVSIFTNMKGVTSVGIDHYGGAQMAVRHLTEIGHRRIACLMEGKAWEARRRSAGYSDALREAGVEPDPAWARLVGPICDEPIAHPYLIWARQHMEEWLNEGWADTGCTAILVQNDAAAVGVLQVMQKAGIKVPEQVSVMGFDGTDICDFVSPNLAAVYVPLDQIGSRAVDIITRQIAGEAMPVESILVPLSLRLGESVSTPKFF